MNAGSPDVVALLLAGGIGARFREGRCAIEVTNKLQARITNGLSTVGLSSAIHLAFGLDGIDHSLIVAVRACDDSVEQMFSHGGFSTISCERASQGMGATLAQAIAQLPQPKVGYLIALADMPYVKPSTTKSIVQRLQHQSPSRAVVVPVFKGKRGNPVAFSYHYRDELMQLVGDKGARDIVAAADNDGSLHVVEVSDEGVSRDIDVRADLW
jgi:molybdenum cofactor cytidylyltransferase